MDYDEVSNRDRSVVAKQLDRDPIGLVGIGYRCKFGFPAVLVTKPLIIRPDGDFEVFPTLFWLTCPKRATEIAHLESGGFIKKLERKLKNEPKLRARYREAEKSYLKAQHELLTPEEETFINHHGLQGALSRGIGGIESDLNVKCLHLHVAHELVTENPLGNVVIKRLELEDCPEDDVICEGLIA
ncbi:DUF501 domain-containing protein [Candidatus Bipolaricaulota bacterium]|nr:DUF501 domain-containing protein [Candidatus Bipolaricaulota bacterium]